LKFLEFLKKTFEKYVYRLLIVSRKIHEECVWKFLELFKNILKNMFKSF
jgi:hypothetical protein